jgi:glutamyl-tRNA synthetase
MGAPFVNETLWMAIRGNLQKLEEAARWEPVCAGHIIPIIEDRDYLTQALACLPEEPWDTATWGLWTGKLKEMTGRKGKELFMPLRQVITGMDHGPEMKELLPLIGYAKVVERLKA